MRPGLLRPFPNIINPERFSEKAGEAQSGPENLPAAFPKTPVDFYLLHYSIKKPLLMLLMEVFPIQFASAYLLIK
jgi:hypothetical protein